MMANSKKRKGKQKYLYFERYFIQSRAWQALRPNAKAAYLELNWRYDGFNNGRIGLGLRELAQALHGSKDSAKRAVDELIEKGFVVKAKASGFNMKGRVATEWRLTEYKCDKTGREPSKDFMSWTPEKNLQSREKDTQSRKKDASTPSNTQNTVHSRAIRTENDISHVSQSREKDTYNITMGGTP